MEDTSSSASEMKVDPVALKAEGEMLLQDADISGALRLWREALSLAEAKAGAKNDNLQHSLRMNLVRGHTRKTEWSSVLEWCNAAIDAGSKDCKAYQWRVIALGRQAKWEEAEAALQDFLSVGGDANFAGRTRKEWERIRKASEEHQSAGNKDGDSSAPVGIRQPSVVHAQTAAESSSGGSCPFSGAPASSSAVACCPFSVAPASSSQRCPFSVSVPAALAAPELEERSAGAVRILAEKGIPASQIAVLLSVDESAVSTVITSDSTGSRKLMGGSGKSLTAGYVGANAKSTVSAGSRGWLDRNALLSAICPLHWNKRILKFVLIGCAVSWFLLLLLLFLFLDHATAILTMTMTMTVGMTLAMSITDGLGFGWCIRKSSPHIYIS